MKLNFDCIRDILLYVEENTNYKESVVLPIPSKFHIRKIDEQYPHDYILEKYGENETFYHIEYCEKAYLLEIEYDSIYLTINDLTPRGHDFLANIRNDNIWNNTKDIASKVGSKSLEALIQISSNVITTIIQKQFNL